MTESLHDRLYSIQQELDAPKGQWNDYSSFHYRSCEDILEGVKPLLNGLTLTLSDDVVQVGDRIYVKATVTISDGENSISNTAMAREPLVKKGMDESQITGTASSYSRKYALNGLFCIDDEKDADSKDNRGQGQQKPKQKKEDKPVNWYQDSQFQNEKQSITDAIRGGMPPGEVIKNLQGQGFAINKKIRAEIESI